MARAEIRGKVSMDAKGVQVGLAQARQAATTFRMQMASAAGALAGAVSVVAIADQARRSLEWAGNIKDLSVAAGLTTTQFQALAASGAKVGVSQDMVATMSSRVTQLLGEAKGGSDSAQKAFAALGITFAELQTMSPEAVLMAVAQQASGAEEGSAQLAAAMDVLGTKSGPRLKQLLAELAAKGFPQLADEARKAGLLIEEGMINKLDRIGDKLDVIAMKVRTSLGSAFGWVVTKIEEASTGLGLLYETATNKGVDWDDAAGSDVVGAQPEEPPKKPAASPPGMLLQSEEEKKLAGQRQKEIQTANENAIEEANREADARFEARRRKADTEYADFQATRKEEKERETERQEDIAGAKKRLEEVKEGKGMGGISPISADEMTRIGALASSEASPMLRVAERGMKIQEEIRDIMKKVPNEISHEIAKYMGLA